MNSHFIISVNLTHLCLAVRCACGQEIHGPRSLGRGPDHWAREAPTTVRQPAPRKPAATIVPFVARSGRRA